MIYNYYQNYDGPQVMLHSQLQMLMNYYRRQETPGGKESLRGSSTTNIMGKSGEYKKVTVIEED